MKWSTGMNNTDKKDLSAEEICRILKQCRGSGVSTFSFSGLAISFFDKQDKGLVAKKTVDSDDKQMSFVENPQVIEQTNKELLEEAHFTQLMIDDPLAFEKMQMSDDLERDRITQ